MDRYNYEVVVPVIESTKNTVSEQAEEALGAAGYVVERVRKSGTEFELDVVKNDKTEYTFTTKTVMYYEVSAEMDPSSSGLWADATVKADVRYISAGQKVTITVTYPEEWTDTVSRTFTVTGANAKVNGSTSATVATDGTPTNNSDTIAVNVAPDKSGDVTLTVKMS